MPAIHMRTFRVRHYECNVHGTLKHAAYLHYMQEAAFDASAAVGYDVARYEAIGHHWLVRETEIDYERPLRYGDSVQIKTWVADFRRIRSRRAYELRLAGSGELVARAYTDWVFLDSAAERPVAIPPEMVRAFLPEGAPEQIPPRPRFPGASPPPGAYRMRRRVEWRDVDEAQHANNAVYLAYLEDCGERMAADHGWPQTRTRAEGFIVAPRRHHIEYRQPGLLGDELEITTWVSDAQRTTAVRHYTFTRAGDGALLARAREIWGTVDAETGQPIPIPAAFLEPLSLPQVSPEL